MDSYLDKVKYFLRQLSPSFFVKSEKELRENLYVLDHPLEFTEKEIFEAEEISEAFFHPEYLTWTKENDKDPMTYARYSPGLRYFEYVPVNLWIAYAIMALPNIPMIRMSKPVRGVFYNMINRMYCITFDYQHRNPTPEELHDYGHLSFMNRLMKVYKDESGENDVWPLGIRYIADIICVFGFSYYIYRFTDLAAATLRWKFKSPKTRLGKITLQSSRQLIPPLMAVSVAHAFDLIFARWAELSLGAAIYGKNGNVIYNKEGKKLLSKKAGRKAVLQTFEQRCITVWTCLTTGAVMGAILTHTVGMPKNPILNLALSMSFFGIGLTAGVPISLAMFDKKIFFTSDHLEKEFNHLLDKDGNPESLYVYRGD